MNDEMICLWNYGSPCVCSNLFGVGPIIDIHYYTINVQKNSPKYATLETNLTQTDSNPTQTANLYIGLGIQN